ncbi:MAG: multicopper oxidase domain-containing protein [Flavobacteriales bacterium]
MIIVRYSCFLSALLLCEVGVAQNALPIPDTLSGAVIDLAVQEGTWQFHPGEVVNTYGINGPLLAPTIILQQGQQVTLNVTNTLPDLTTMHWHGLHVSAANDGGPHSLIYPNTTWSPTFTVMDKASTYWYHPHGHGLTDYQVTLGLAGMIIVRDPEEAALPLPRTYGVDDIPLILQAKAIVGGQVMVHTGLDSIIVANGVRNAWKEMPAQVVRLRCLNGSSERTFNLGFSNGMDFHLIGTDGGLLGASVLLNRLRLMPGERAELLVDLGTMQGQSFQLMAYNSELPNGIIGSPQVGNGMAYLDGYQENALNGADHPLCSFTVGAPTTDAITSIPGTLVNLVPFNEADATVTRTFDMQPQGMGPLEMIEGPFELNGNIFDMDVINETVNLGTTEIWEFVNNTMVGHPMHIHDVQFNILDRNGLPVPSWEQGRKDVVYVPPMGSARVVTRFDDFADPDMAYMYHCHLLMHEDEGMMGQFVVIDPNAIGELSPSAVALTAWPNPSPRGDVRLVLPGMNGSARIVVRDALGRVVGDIQTRFEQGTSVLSTSTFAPGAYAVAVFPSSQQRSFITELILQP